MTDCEHAGHDREDGELEDGEIDDAGLEETQQQEAKEDKKQRNEKNEKNEKSYRKSRKKHKKEREKKNPKGENVRNISIILHQVMIVPTTALIQMLNIQKVPIKRELVSTGIMTFHFLSMDTYQEAT